jgi:hypothetical protein
MYNIKIHIIGTKYMEALINSFTKLHKFSCLQGESDAEGGSEPICRSCSSSSKGWGEGLDGMEGPAAEDGAI